MKGGSLLASPNTTSLTRSVYIGVRILSSPFDKIVRKKAWREKMVEEVEKSSSVTEEPTMANNPQAADDDDGEAPEEGEIVSDDDTSSSAKPTAALAAESHPLEHSWTFWFDNPSAKTKQAPWGSSIRPIYTFSTVEGFWSIYNNIHLPSKLTAGADLHCFKNKIEPKWEDPVCANGGKWTLTFSKGKSDTSWLYTLLAMIGEQFDNGDEICGAVVNVRPKQDKIGLWTKNAANEMAQVSIGRQWKECLDSNDSIGFIFHDDAKVDRNPKTRYTV